MKKRKLLCLVLTLVTMVTMLRSPSAVSASEPDTDKYVQDGLVSWFKGDQNSANGHNTNASVWTDLVSGYDLPVKIDQNNYFTEEGFRVNGQKHYFPDEVLNLVNESYFTIEIEFGDFDPYGQSYNVFMNSSNDYFSLFRRVSENVIEWKFGGGNTRPKIPNSLKYLGGHLLTFTCEFGGSIVMYVDGAEMARADCDLYMGANDLFIGQTTESRSYDALYKHIRFYSRPLSSDEVEQNARSMGYDPESISENKSNISVAQPVTNIVGDVAVIRPIDSREEFDRMMDGDSLPATAIYEINDRLEVLDCNGQPFSTVAEVLKASHYQILPCFNIQNRATAQALAHYLDQNFFYDIQIMSADKSVLQYARTLLPCCYGILDLRAEYAQETELSKEQLLDIRQAVKIYNAAVAVLPVSLCRNQDIQYLYERQVNVWAWGTDAPDSVEPYYALLSGAVGVVTKETDLYLEIACEKLAQNTLTRVPTNVGHRGTPPYAPENTLESSILAYEQGANVIEMDVYLTQDGHIVAIHDNTTGRTCDQNLAVESSTLAQLKTLYANKGFKYHPDYSTCRIPTLAEYFEWFKGKDCLFFIEIKSYNPAIVSALKELVEQYDNYDQCSVITFNHVIMEAMREDYPEMSVGALSDITMSSASADADMHYVMNFIGQYNGTHNPYCGGYDENDLRACLIRGISVYPWTINGTPEDLSYFFISGYSGLTNNYAHVLQTVARKLSYSEITSLPLNRGIELRHVLTTYDGTTLEQPVSYICLLEGNARISWNAITPLEVGEITYMTASVINLFDQYTYVMYSQPVTVSVYDPNADTDSDTETTPESEPESDVEETTAPVVETDRSDLGDTTITTESDEDTSHSPPNTAPKGCGSLLSGSACILTLLGAAMIYIRRRNRA